MEEEEEDDATLSSVSGGGSASAKRRKKRLSTIRGRGVGRQGGNLGNFSFGRLRPQKTPILFKKLQNVSFFLNFCKNFGRLRRPGGGTVVNKNSVRGGSTFLGRSPPLAHVC